jgi:elongation factor 1-gamma
MKELKEWLKLLNSQLKGKDFLVGDAYTMADLEVFMSLRAYFQLIFSEELRKNVFPNVVAWFAKLAVHPFMVESYGRTLLCKVPQKAPTIEFKKVAPKKKEEPKKEETTKAEKPNDADGDEEKSSKKKANPLDLLPPPTLVLDDFKREFLNSKDKPAVLKDFWTKYNDKDYSLCWMKYEKLPSEGKILFRTKNSMGFFLQKLDGFRKYSFAAHGIYGPEGDYDIKGVWMWRGSEIPEEVIFIL